MVDPKNLFLHNNEGLDEFLAVAIAVLFLSTSIFFLLTVYRKFSRRRSDQKKKTYYQFYNQLMSKMLFQDLPVADAVGELKANYPQQGTLLKKVGIKSITSLHRNYAGQYKKMLEDFYVLSGLSDYSLAKLRRDDWHVITEGIRELAYFRYFEAIPLIRKFITDRNPAVRKEALVALSELEGISSLLPFKDQGFMLDDWTQSKILYSLVTRQAPFEARTAELLSAANHTFALLGARIISHFQQAQYLPQLQTAATAITGKEKAEFLQIVHSFQNRN